MDLCPCCSVFRLFDTLKDFCEFGCISTCPNHLKLDVQIYKLFGHKMRGPHCRQPLQYGGHSSVFCWETFSFVPVTGSISEEQKLFQLTLGSSSFAPFRIKWPRIPSTGSGRASVCMTTLRCGRRSEGRARCAVFTSWTRGSQAPPTSGSTGGGKMPCVVVQFVSVSYQRPTNCCRHGGLSLTTDGDDELQCCFL